MTTSVTFDLVFQSLQDFDSDQQIYDDQISAINHKQLTQDCATNIQRIRSLKSFHRSKLMAKSTTISHAMDIMKKTVSNSQKANSVSKLATLRRLYQQRIDYDRRIRELVYEIYGEYGKTRTRLARRNDYLHVVGIINSIYALWYVCWERFSCRFTYELTTKYAIPHNSRHVTVNIASSCFLCPCIFQKEYASIMAMLQDNGMRFTPAPGDAEAGDAQSPSGREYEAIEALVRFQFNHRIDPKNPSKQLVSSFSSPGSTAGTGAGSAAAVGLMVADTVAEMQAIFDVLGGVYKLAQGSYGSTTAAAAGGKRRESVAPASTSASEWTAALSCKYIKWLHVNSLQPAAAWDRVYAEQRLQQQHHYHQQQQQELGSGIEASAATTEGSDDNDAEAVLRRAECFQLTEFANKMLLQYTSFTVNEHLYVCLEERYWADKEREGTDELDKFNARVQKNSGMANADQSKMMFHMLQELYVNKSVVTAPSRDELAELVQSGTMYVTGSENKHRQGVGRGAHMNDNPTIAHTLAILSSYPDVIEVQCQYAAGSVKANRGPATLHFAVATVYSLEELRFFNLSCADRKKPQRLYSLSRFLGKFLDATAPGTKAQSDGAGSGSRTDLTLMVALSDICVNELVVEHKLCEPAAVSSSSEVDDSNPQSAPSSASGPRPKSASDSDLPRPSFLHLLPDSIRHCSEFHDSAYTARSNKQLEHTYVLMGNPQSPCNQKQYFLVQLRRTQQASTGSGAEVTDGELMSRVVRYHTGGYNRSLGDAAGPAVFDSTSCNASCCLTMGAKSSFCFNSAVQATANASLGPLGGVRCVDETIIEQQEQALLKQLGLLSMDSAASASGGGGSGASGKGSKGPKTAVDNDTAMLSSLCYWRTCQCEALPASSAHSANTGAFRLCRYHSEMQYYFEVKDAVPVMYQKLNKRFAASIDIAHNVASGCGDMSAVAEEQLQRANSALSGIIPTAKVSNNSEIWKFLPKKPPRLNYSVDNRDYKIIMAASTLLQELCSANAKLFTTLSSFISKTIDQEMKIKKRLYSVLTYVNSVIETTGSISDALGSISLSPTKGGVADAFAMEFIGDKATGVQSSGKKMKKKGGNAGTSSTANLSAFSTAPAAGSVGELEYKCRSTARLLQKKIAQLMSGYLAKQSWTRWKNPDELHKHLGRLEDEYRMIFDVLSFERNNTNEITILSELGVYPSAECALIRKDLKAFNDQKANNASAGASAGAHSSETAMQELLTEVKLAEKKNAVLYTRRMEEAEHRAMVEKKQSRKKDKEQKDARDPMNFANHSGRK